MHSAGTVASSLLRRSITLFGRSNSLLLGMVVFLLIAVGVMLSPYLHPTDPLAMDFSRILEGPSSGAPLGTDDMGRDVLARVLFGGRTSLLIGLQVMVITAVFGTMIGLAAGASRRLDEILMRLMDVLLCFPALLLALGILAALGQGAFNVVIALSLVFTPRTARVVRAEVLSLRENVYVEAALALGASRFRVLLRHVLPGIVPTLIVQETFLFAYAILGEAGLSFVGVGTQPPTPSWGNILGDARVVMREAPWMVFAPGLALSLTILSLNLLGDGLREVLDPKRRKR